MVMVFTSQSYNNYCLYMKVQLCKFGGTHPKPSVIDIYLSGTPNNVEATKVSVEPSFD